MNKKTIGIIIGAIVVIGLVIGGIFFFNEKKDEKAQEEVANQWITSLKDQKFKSFPKLVTTKSLKSQGYTTDDLVTKYTKVFGGIGVNDIKISDVKIQDQILTYKMKLHTSIGDTSSFSYKAKIVEENEEFKIVWNPNLIFPNMKSTDKISFNSTAAKRGNIKDVNGLDLATVNKAFQAGIIPKDLGIGGERTKNIAAISKFLDLPVSSIEATLKQSWVKDFLFVPLKTVADEDVRKMTGLQYKATEIRYYPLGEAAANLIGYTGKVTAEDLKKDPSLRSDATIGKAGLERAYDAKLRGTDGGEISLTDEQGNVKEKLLKSEVVDGEDIGLTIDLKVQKEAYFDLERAVGSTVVMQPKSGALIALVSKPSFDPNQMVRGISQEAYNKYVNNEDKPFMARYAQRYAPGSTMKAITAAVGFDEGTLTTDKTRKINGLQWQKDASWGNYKVTRVAEQSVVNYKNALIQSDNIFFAQEGLELGEKKLRAGLNKFGFGKDYDLPFAMEPAQISTDQHLKNEILLADTSYGQGQVLMSPIQQAVAFSAFANEGKIVSPHILKGEKSKTSEATTPKTVKLVNDALVQVVENPKGTAHNLQKSGTTLAAKTGTAELKMEQGTEGQQNSFLFAFDRKKENYLVVSFVENHKKTGKSAVELAKNLLPTLEKIATEE